MFFKETQQNFVLAIAFYERIRTNEDRPCSLALAVGWSPLLSWERHNDLQTPVLEALHGWAKWWGVLLLWSTLSCFRLSKAENRSMKPTGGRIIHCRKEYFFHSTTPSMWALITSNICKTDQTHPKIRPIAQRPCLCFGTKRFKLRVFTHMAKLARRPKGKLKEVA